MMPDEPLSAKSTAQDKAYLDDLKACPVPRHGYWARAFSGALLLVLFAVAIALLGARFYQQQQVSAAQQSQIEHLERTLLALPEAQGKRHALAQAWQHSGANTVLSERTLGAWLHAHADDAALPVHISVEPLLANRSPVMPVQAKPVQAKPVQSQPHPLTGKQEVRKQGVRQPAAKRTQAEEMTHYRLTVSGPVRPVSQWLSTFVTRGLAIHSLNWSRQAQGQWQLALQVSSLPWPDDWLAVSTLSSANKRVRLASGHGGFASHVLLPAELRHQCEPTHVSAFATTALDKLQIKGRSQYQQQDFVWLRDPKRLTLASVSPGQWFARPAHLLTEVLPGAFVTQQGRWLQGRCDWQRHQWPLLLSAKSR